MNEVSKQELFSPEKIELLKKTICKGSTNEELELFIHVCKKTGLDPFMKQIFGVKRKTKDGDVMTIQTSIDGFRLIADRTGNYAPGKEPTFKYEDGKLISATSYVKKRTPDGTWHEVSANALLSEYMPAFASNFWKDKPHLMLAKCAEALALRKAFPADMNGIYAPEETDREVVETVSTEGFITDLEEKVLSLGYSRGDLQSYLEKWERKFPNRGEFAKRCIENQENFLKDFRKFVSEKNAEVSEIDLTGEK